MPKNPHELAARAQSIQSLLDDLSEHCLFDIGPHLSCDECEALANVFYFHGYKEKAAALRYGHVSADSADEGDCKEHLELKEKWEANPPCCECYGETDNGEGYDGLCGNCADKAESKGD